MRIPFIPSKQLPDSNQYDPIEPQIWHFRQSIEYSVTANRAVLDIASRNRENFLFNIYRMGLNSIERGSRDTWTITPRRVQAAEAALKRTADDQPGDEFDRLLRDPPMRDPRGYIIPFGQPDFPTATAFINALIENGVAVQRAAAGFSVAGKAYPAGSWIVKTAQAFRPHVLDMFEPQDHPDDIPYPGGPPTPPYDNAGYTLAYQMGVQFDRVLDDFSGPFERVDGLQKPPAGRVTGSGSSGYLLGRGSNAAFAAVNQLLAGGEEVSWITSGPQAGMFRVSPNASTRGELESLAAKLGVNVDAAPAPPAGPVVKLRTLRIGLSDRYGGSMPSGWTRLIFERFGFPFEVVFPKTLDAGNLIDKYDVIVFPSDMISDAARLKTCPTCQDTGPGSRRAATPVRIPAEFDDQLGAITEARTIPQLRKFLEDGGTIVAVGKSTAIAGLMGLPVTSHLVERGSDGALKPLPSDKYYVPGSVLRVAVDRGNPVTQGLADHVDVFFDNDPVFELTPDAALTGIRPVAWFDSSRPLRSGWAFGQGYLEKGIVGLDVPVGSGRLFLFTPEITFRAQSHGTFKFLFNAIYLAAQSPGR
jgi:hypothetical protein